MNWFDKLERRFGRWSIPNLTSILVGGQIVVYAVALFVNRNIASSLSLYAPAVLSGEVWRLVTFLFVPYAGGGILGFVLEAYFLHAHTAEEICETYQIAHSTLYVFRRLFLSHKRLILGVLDDAQEKAAGFIGKIDGKQLFQFWDSFRYSFLQAYHASDFHHR